MGNVKFGGEEEFKRRMASHHQEKEFSFLTKFLMKASLGFIKNQEQANKVMVVIAITLFAYSLFLIVTKVVLA